MKKDDLINAALAASVGALVITGAAGPDTVTIDELDRFQVGIQEPLVPTPVFENEQEKARYCTSLLQLYEAFLNRISVPNTQISRGLLVDKTETQQAIDEIAAEYNTNCAL